MRRISGFAILTLLAFAAWGQSGEREGEDELSQWYVGAQVGLARVDDEFGASDDGEFIRAALGRHLGNTMAAELEVSTGSVDFDNGSDLDQHTISINVLLINRSVQWNPYFLVGAGGFKNEADTFSDTGAMVQVGAGGMWDLNGYGMMLRADVRYRYSDLDIEAVDQGQWVVGIGLDFPFR